MKNIVFGCLGLIVWGGVAGCERKPTEPGQIPGAAATGMLRVMLGSEPAMGQIDPNVDEVWVRVDSVEARHQSEGWVTVSNERQDFDLLGGMGGGDGGMGGGDDGGMGGGDDDGGMGGGNDDGRGDDGRGDDGRGDDGGLAGGEDGGVNEDGDVGDLSPQYELLGEGRVWAGGYDRLHLGITDAWIVVEGQQQDLEFIGNIDPLDPFDKGLNINEPFYVDENATTIARVLWNVGENLERKDNGEFSLGAQTTLDVDIEEQAGGGVAGGGGNAGGGGGNY